MYFERFCKKTSDDAASFLSPPPDGTTPSRKRETFSSEKGSGFGKRSFEVLEEQDGGNGKALLSGLRDGGLRPKKASEVAFLCRICVPELAFSCKIGMNELAFSCKICVCELAFSCKKVISVLAFS